MLIIIKLFIKLMIIWPNIILIIKRKAKVKIWMKNLFNSIRLINGIKNKGVFLGVKFIKKIFMLLFKLKIKKLLINQKEKFKVKIILVEI